MNTSRKEIVVIAHDAGAAEIIAAFLRHKKNLSFHAYVAGPAARIFRRDKIPFKAVSADRTKIAKVLQAHQNAAYALIGTGWMTRIERDALETAKKLGIDTRVYLDSWEEYPKRFGYPMPGWRKNLPDELWVGDASAMRLAQKYFPKTSIRSVPNQYFADIKARYQQLKRSTLPKSILFLGTTAAESEKVLSDLLRSLAATGKRPHLRIRYHPAETKGRYDALIRKYRKSIELEVSKEKDILRDLVRAKSVVGLETVPLVLAVLLKIPAIRIVPKSTKTFLPFPAIRRAPTGSAAARLMLHS